MKVLKDNFTDFEKNIEIENNTKPYPRFHICEGCLSELEYEKSDLTMGYLGAMYLKCPLCGYNNMMEHSDEAGITLTKDNVQFPVHFWHTSKETGAVDCCNNEEVKECIRKAIDYFRANKNEYHWFTATGNLYVSVDRYDGDESYEIMVTNNYYETSIPFENVDY